MFLIFIRIIPQCSPHEFYSVCKALETVYESFKMFREAVNTSKASDWLKQLVAEIPELLCDIEDFSKALNEKEARLVIFHPYTEILQDILQVGQGRHGRVSLLQF